MKKIFILFLLALFSQYIFAENKTKITVIENNTNHTVLQIQVGDIHQILTEASLSNSVKIQINQATNLLQKGAPNLPKINFSLTIPNDKNSSIQILESNFIEYNNINVSPSKGKILRTKNPKDIPFEYGDIYQTNELFPNQNAILNTPYIFRDKRGQVVQINPVQYNPITKILRVFTSFKIEVKYDGVSSINFLGNTNNIERHDEIFEGIYQNHFINYNADKKTRYTPILEEGTMLIICPNIYLNTIQDFVKWKEMKGIKTYVVNADTITGGINETTIFNTAKYYFQTKQISSMIIIGDNADIPAVNQSFAVTDPAGPSDIAYAYMNGNDHYPEFMVGRFSGNNAEEILNNINRTLNYEKTPNIVGNWMSQQIGIASEQGTGDDNQYDYEHIHEIVDSNNNQYNYTNNFELYDGALSQGGNDAAGYPTAAMLETNINSGASLINYCGHGSASGIVTTNFSTIDVPTLHNENKLPFFLVVGCQPGNFINQTSFAETLMRAGSSSTPLGTISCFMSTIDQYWDEPMQAQDEFNAVMRGARPNNLKTRLGALCLSGCASMNDQYNVFNDPTGGSDMTDTWVFFGDPTVSLFNKNEGNISCTHTAEIGRNSTWYSVNCPVEDATIGLYYQGNYLAHAKVIGGVATFNFDAIANLDTLFITATKQNYVPYMGFAKVVDFPTNIQNITANNTLNIFPNPSTDFTSIETNNNDLIDKIKVIDMNGKVIFSENYHSNKIILNTKNFAKGNYILNILSKEKTIQYKLNKI